MMKGLGKGIKEFKKGMQDDPEDTKVESKAADPAVAGRNGNKA
jgi:Sec-independent protein translocase protein TatA